MAATSSFDIEEGFPTAEEENDSGLEDEDFDVTENIEDDSNENSEDKKRKRKRRNIDQTKRRRIRRILQDSELQSETLEAQQEERERLKRLELQKSLITESASTEQKIGLQTLLAKASEKTRASAGSPTVVGYGTSGSRSASPLVLDFREEKKCEQNQVIVIDSDDEVAPLNEPHPQAVEVISSDSELEELGDDDDDNDDEVQLDYDNSGAHSEDLQNCCDSQGRVLVNVGHPANEEDIFLSPTLARNVKPHQVLYKPVR